MNWEKGVLQRQDYIAYSRQENESHKAGNQKNPPTVCEWIHNVNEVTWKEKVVYIKRGNLKEFEKMWKPWLEEMGCPP